jgi:endonuclease/exonuclease/phosphatase family metal-dependent hydrolase
VKVLFWNLWGKSLVDLTARLVAERDVDVVILAEPDGINDTELVKALSAASHTPFIYHQWEPQARLRIYSRFPISSVVALADSAGIAIRQLTQPGCKPLIMAAVHSSSQRHWPQPADRWALAARIRDKLETAESNQQHRRSFLVGDFNSDPFDDAIVNSDTLHAVMTKQIALQKTRVVGGETRHFLYNPMWSLFGDCTSGPPGSYYYRVANSSCRFWHVFDQVLLRPELIGAFDQGELAIVTSIGPTHLAKATGEPDPEVASDHFPLVFALNTLGSFPNV